MFGHRERSTKIPAEPVPWSCACNLVMGHLHLLAVAAFGPAAAAAITEEVFVIRNLKFLKVQNDIHLVSPPFGIDSHKIATQKMASGAALLHFRQSFAMLR